MLLAGAFFSQICCSCANANASKNIARSIIYFLFGANVNASGKYAWCNIYFPVLMLTLLNTADNNYLFILGTQQAAVPPSCFFSFLDARGPKRGPEALREATVAQGGSASIRMVPKGSQRGLEKPKIRPGGKSGRQQYISSIK